MRKQFEQYLLNCFLLYYEGVTDEEDKIQRIYMFSGILYCYGIMRMPEGGEGMNREINWLEFDAKVLDEATDAGLPLLEQRWMRRTPGAGLWTNWS